MHSLLKLIYPTSLILVFLRRPLFLQETLVDAERPRSKNTISTQARKNSFPIKPQIWTAPLPALERERNREGKIPSHGRIFLPGTEKKEGNKLLKAGFCRKAGNAELESFALIRENLMLLGIPRSLFFYYYSPFWTTFWRELGVDCLLSPPTTPAILQQGLELALDEFCLPVKVHYGHLAYLENRVTSSSPLPLAVGASAGTSAPSSKPYMIW